MNGLAPELIRHLVRTALAEDIGAGDITTEAAIPADARAEAVIIAKEHCVVAGLAIVETVFNELDGQLVATPLVSEGTSVKHGVAVFRLAGRARTILTGERTALNFLQRISGIATLTRQFVDAVAGTKAKVLDTRKTTPTLRALEKYAVTVGGGTNHRLGLFDAVMIKDNHRVILARLGPAALARAIATARKTHHDAPVIIEADTLDQVDEALAAGADHILLDNMTTEELRTAVTAIKGRAKSEASGGVSLATVAQIAATGVDFISVGALTHSSRAVDFSLEINEEAGL